MSRVPKWKIEKAKVKVVFRLQFHATNIPSTGWDKLFLSFISADTGKVSAKTNKANVRNGSCKWPDPIYEATRLLQDSRTKTYDDKLYKIVVAMGTSRSSILGELDVNLAEFAEALKPVSIALPLRGCEFGTILHLPSDPISIIPLGFHLGKEKNFKFKRTKIPLRTQPYPFALNPISLGAGEQRAAAAAAPHGRREAQELAAAGREGRRAARVEDGAGARQQVFGCCFVFAVAAALRFSLASLCSCLAGGRRSREFEQQRETGAKSTQQLVNQRSHDPSEIGVASSDIYSHKANARIKLKETSSGFPLAEDSAGSTEDYENSSHNSDGLFAEKIDSYGGHEL
uniref:C2 NT-type domain-containing protein n=1 Tax=Oryza nivara TaxID=4536 RepID=A0A0E0IR53_ORYNI